MAQPATAVCELRAALPFTDVTLRAGADGAIVAAHRGVLARQSRVFSDAFNAELSPNDVFPLPGKTQADLDVLMAYLYPRAARNEGFTLDNIDTVCKLAREYDIPDMLDAAHSWLVATAGSVVKANTFSGKNDAVLRIRLLALAHEFHFKQFFDMCMAELQQQQPGKLKAIFADAPASKHLDSEVLHALLLQSFDTWAAQQQEHAHEQQRHRYRYGYS